MATHEELNLAPAIGSHALAARRAVQAACFGFFVDMFDVYLPIAVLAPALSYFIPAGLSGTTQATIFYVVFAVTLIGRPLGALIFGYFGDRLGRRQTCSVRQSKRVSDKPERFRCHVRNRTDRGPVG
jgi:MFS family permease